MLAGLLTQTPSQLTFRASNLISGGEQNGTEVRKKSRGNIRGLSGYVRLLDPELVTAQDAVDNEQTACLRSNSGIGI